MATSAATIGPVAAVLGDLCRPAEIAGFEERWERETSGANPDVMGVGTFSRIDEPLADCIVRSVLGALDAASVLPADLDHLVLSTMDRGLARLDEKLASSVLHRAGLTRCVPVLISHQQCCSSLAALGYASNVVLADGGTAVVVAFDQPADDLDRVRPFAFFGDAVTSCVVRAGDGPVSLHAVEVGVDYPGLIGEDSFASRQAVARSTLGRLVPAAVDGLAGRPVFSVNLFRPVSMFNATVAGLKHDDLHCEATRAAYGHCGNCDWMLNLAEYGETRTPSGDRSCLLHASAPGFYGAADITVHR